MYIFGGGVGSGVVLLESVVASSRSFSFISDSLVKKQSFAILPIKKKKKKRMEESIMGKASSLVAYLLYISLIGNRPSRTFSF